MCAEIYPNQPLIEAVFEIRFDGELSVDSDKDKFYNSIRANFPKLSFSQQSTIETGFRRFLCKDVTGSEAVQFSIDRCSFHSYKYSGGYAAFGKNALKVISGFCNRFNIETIKRTGLRYIDHIPIVREEGLIPLKKYLNFWYELPKSLSETFGYENLLTMLEVKKGDGHLRLQISSLQREDGIDMVVLDFDYAIFGELKVSNLKNYLETSHAHTKQVFEDLITDYLRQIMRGNKG